MIKKLNILNILLMQLAKNKIVIAVAGAGKTWDICKKARDDINKTQKKILLITYTNKGIESLKNEYKKQNFGIIDKNIVFKTWYQFLLSDFIKPYQNYITHHNFLIRSIDFSKQYGFVNYKKRWEINHYVNRSGDVLSNSASELAIDINEISCGKSISRVEKIYSSIYIDEVQDLAGEDLNILNILFDSKINITCVGDNKQSTYSTHVSKKNKNNVGQNINTYFFKIKEEKELEIVYNIKTRRFGDNIANFANYLYGDESEFIIPNDDGEFENDGVMVISKKDFKNYYKYYNPTILKFDSRTDVENYNSYNFGQCKGMTFDRIAIFPNKVLIDFLSKSKIISSKPKYYVGVTRAKYSVIFVLDNIFENENFKYEMIKIGDTSIKISKYQKRT